MSRAHGLTAILPCKDLDASEAFYAKLGFTRNAAHENYRILSDGKDGNIHHSRRGMVDSWAQSLGLYLYTENVDGLAAALGDLVLHGPENKPWGMYEFALSDPDETLVRVGWPTPQP